MNINRNIRWYLSLLVMGQIAAADITLTPEAPRPEAAVGGKVYVEGCVECLATEQEGWTSGTNTAAYRFESGTRLTGANGDGSDSLLVDGEEQPVSGIYGGSLTISAVDLTVQNCHIMATTSESSPQGGGMRCSNLTLDQAGTIILSNNRVTVTQGDAMGGGIFATNYILRYCNSSGLLQLSGNSCVGSGSHAGGGGADLLYAIFQNNASARVVFEGNSLVGNPDSPQQNAERVRKGGALLTLWFAVQSNGVDAEGNPMGNVDFLFRGNRIEDATWGAGAAISLGGFHQMLSGSQPRPWSYGLIFQHNYGELSFIDNSVQSEGQATGGAISMASSRWAADYSSYPQYGFGIINNHGDISFLNNSVTGNSSRADGYYGAAETYVRGGAVYAEITPYFYLDGNEGDVLFRGNWEHDLNPEAEVAYRLRSLYVENAKEYALGAAEDFELAFYDSFYLGSSFTEQITYLNDTGAGTIRLSGATTVADLLAAGCDEPTEAEVAASRTSVIEQAVSLERGTLALEDGAVLRVGQGAGVTAASTIQSGAQISFCDGHLESATELQFRADSSLSLSRNSVRPLSLESDIPSSVSTLRAPSITWNNVTINVSGVDYRTSDIHYLTISTNSLTISGTLTLNVDASVLQAGTYHQ
ncbi:MAG: hypothetical protein ACI4OS_05205, partial [Akkermansia sp.]